MKNYSFAFFVTEKRKSRLWGDLLFHSAKTSGDKIEIFPKETIGDGAILKDFDGAAILGMARLGTSIKDACRRYDKHLLYFDKGYTKRSHWRVSVDDWQPLEYFQKFKRPSDRFDAWKLPVEGWCDVTEKGHIVLAGACQNYSNFMGLGDVTEYNRSVVELIRQHSDRPIVYRPNPSWAVKHSDEFKEIEGTTTSLPPETFDDVLVGCHTVVSHGTSACLTAIAKGVPNLILGPGIAKSLSLTERDWERLEETYRPKEKARYQFFCDLAYCQWTLAEFRSGVGWEEVRRALALVSGTPFSKLGYSLIDQYKIMHESDYFRGLSTVKCSEAIKKIVEETGAKTLLDYGSGKGDQYAQEFKLQDVWDTKVTCYDPAVKAFSTLPNKTFDGVICCDVMEHIPEVDVQETLKRILSYANSFVYFYIATIPASKTLPDGTNCHVTVKPLDWWRQQIQMVQKLPLRIEVQGGEG